jgi:trans-aconitate methyltransferase
MNQDFSEISKRYSATSIIQNSASDLLIGLLNIQRNESVLDVGCGTGMITKKLYDISQGYVVGIDPSAGMIEESIKQYGQSILFQVGSSEHMTFTNMFDVLFCNSAFQWVQDSRRSVKNFFHALKSKGRLGIQAPAKKDYCPNFIQAVNSIYDHKKLGPLFKKFKSPWLFFNASSDYADLFRRQGFHVPLCEIQTKETLHSPQEVYTIFASGAIAGYLNKAYYECAIDDEHIQEFQNVIKEEFAKQAAPDGKVRLVFNRIYLLAMK